MPQRLLAVLLSLLVCQTLFAADIYEPKPGSAERTALMDAMRKPVSKHVGTRVTFTGTLKSTGSWAVFHGDAAPTDGKVPETDNAAELELDFFALLQKQGGTWVAVSWSFAGDIGPIEEAKKKFPAAPKSLFRSLFGDE
jgi:hypothetical protein